jgi:hypothetical protein
MRTGARWLPILFATDIRPVPVLQPLATATCQLIDSASAFGRDPNLRVDSVMAN